MTRVDGRIPLPVLRETWSECQSCELGTRRLSVGGELVTGQGALGGIAFVGENTGVEEETEGVPFVGSGGVVLRNTLQKYQLDQVAYFTNIVACRSCAAGIDADGNVMRDRRGNVYYRDQEPTSTQTESCAPRLFQELYTVDPVLIVALGNIAAKRLLQRPVTYSEAGKLFSAKLPGHAHVPRLTEKRQLWLRKYKGEWVTPTTQNEVEYPVLVALSPNYVLANINDQRMGNPAATFDSNMRITRRLYDKLLEACGS